jgi:hypothetical protein
VKEQVKASLPIYRDTPPMDVLELWFDYMVEAGLHKGKWDPEVRIQIRPKKEQKFKEWFDAKHDFFTPISNAVVGYDSLNDAVERLAGLGENETTRNTFVVSLDLRAPNKVLVEELERALDYGRREYRIYQPMGRPSGYPVWVEYAPNGLVDVQSLHTSLKVLQAQRDQPDLSNAELWNAVLGKKRAAVADASKSSIISRHLGQAKNVVLGVRNGCFPFHDRPRGRGLDD